MPLSLPLSGFGGRVLPQGRVVGVASRGQGPGWGVVMLRAALTGAGRAVVQGVRAVGATSGAQEEVGAAQWAEGVRVCVGVRCQQFTLRLKAGAAVPKVLSETVQTCGTDVHGPVRRTNRIVFVRDLTDGVT